MWLPIVSKKKRMKVTPSSSSKDTYPNKMKKELWENHLCPNLKKIVWDLTPLPSRNLMSRRSLKMVQCKIRMTETNRYIRWFRKATIVVIKKSNSSILKWLKNISHRTDSTKNQVLMTLNSYRSFLVSQEAPLKMLCQTLNLICNPYHTTSLLLNGHPHNNQTFRFQALPKYQASSSQRGSDKGLCSFTITPIKASLTQKVLMISQKDSDPPSTYLMLARHWTGSMIKSTRNLYLKVKLSNMPSTPLLIKTLLLSRRSKPSSCWTKDWKL